LGAGYVSTFYLILKKCNQHLREEMFFQKKENFVFAINTAARRMRNKKKKRINLIFLETLYFSISVNGIQTPQTSFSFQIKHDKTSKNTDSRVVEWFIRHAQTCMTYRLFSIQLCRVGNDSCRIFMATKNQTDQDIMVRHESA